jgi:3-oxoacyl-[acyl-carrier protein] reductase
MLKGKTAVITGASRGIGRAIALKLAAEQANVAIIYCGSMEKAAAVQKEALAFGVKALTYQCDVADGKACSETVNQILTDFGTVDILVNNAGITRDKLMLQMNESDFDHVIDTNFSACFIRRNAFL